jgi:hypothetical protein
VIRVRGKNILLLSLMAMMLTIMMGVNPTTAAPGTSMAINPSAITGLPGDSFDMSVEIASAVDVWAVQFTVKVAPYVSVLTFSNIQEGDFMNDGGAHPTYFTYTTDSFEGTFTVVILRLGGEPREGASGYGTLATFKLFVVESGESPIDLIEVILLNPEGDPLPVKTHNGFFYGPTARLIRAHLPLGRKVKAGVDFTINAKVKVEAEFEMEVRVRYDITRLEDSRTIRVYAGQTYSGGGLGEPRPFEYLYVDEFNEWYYEWAGDPTNLFGEPDGSYIQGNNNAEWASLYSFEAISLGGREIADITLEGYTQYPNGATDAVDIDVYDVSGGFAWWGSLYGSPSWGWSGVRWTSDTVLQTSPWLADETTLNDVQVLVYNYHGDAPDVPRLDSMRLKVEFAAITPVEIPQETVPPGIDWEMASVTWLSAEDHIGTYEWTATIEYQTEGFKWNSWGSAQKTGFFWIVP